MPATTTIAGRHAADVARQRAALAANPEQDNARRTLEAMFRRHGLRCFASLYPEDAEPSIAVNCRLEHADDHDWIYAALDDNGWRPNPARLTRIRAGYDVLRVIHDTGATLVLVVKVPSPARSSWEAA